MKKLTKSSVKKEIKRIFNETISKCVKLARVNGYEICGWTQSLVYTPSDFTKFKSGEELVKKDRSNMFITENIEDLPLLCDRVMGDDILLVTESDIKRFIKDFDRARALHLNRVDAEKKARQDKIKELRKALADLELEETNDK